MTNEINRFFSRSVLVGQYIMYCVLEVACPGTVRDGALKGTYNSLASYPSLFFNVSDKSLESLVDLVM